MPHTRTTESIVTPIIHLNGNRRETLLDQLAHAFEAVNQAIDALRQCAPNGRNYYPEPGRLKKAEAQHSSRMEHLERVRDSLEAEAIKIQDEAQIIF